MHAGHRHRADAFFAADKTQVFIRGRLDPNAIALDPKRLGNVCLHRGHVRRDLRRLHHQRGVDVNDAAVTQRDLPGGFREKDSTRSAAPFRVGVGKESSNVALADSTEHRVTNRMHQHIRIRMPIEPFRVHDFNAAQNELSTIDKLMDVVADAYVMHVPQYKRAFVEVES